MTQEPTTTTTITPEVVFDYDELCTEDRQFVRDATDDIHYRWLQTTENVIAIGKHLTEVKGRLTHGQFGRWLAAEFRWSDRHARNFINAYEWTANRKSISALAIQLEPTAVYQLAAPSTPAPARQEVLAKVEWGERVTPKAVKAIVAKHKPTKRSAQPKSAGGDREPPSPKAPKLDPIVAMRQLEAALREAKTAPSDWAAELPPFRRRALLGEINALCGALQRLADALRQQLDLDQPEQGAPPPLSPPEPPPEELAEELAEQAPAVAEAQPNGDDALGARLRAYRKANGLTLKTVASLVECSDAQLSNVETGKSRGSAALRARIEQTIAQPQP
jgi:hypothetical protein